MLVTFCFSSLLCFCPFFLNLIHFNFWVTFNFKHHLAKLFSCEKNKKKTTTFDQVLCRLSVYLDIPCCSLFQGFSEKTPANQTFPTTAYSSFNFKDDIFVPFRDNVSVMLSPLIHLCLSVLKCVAAQDHVSWLRFAPFPKFLTLTAVYDCMIKHESHASRSKGVDWIKSDGRSDTFSSPSWPPPLPLP